MAANARIVVMLAQRKVSVLMYGGGCIDAQLSLSIRRSDVPFLLVDSRAL
jgi:hypothetical protein